MENNQTRASMPFNVKIFIVDGRPDGLRLILKTGWDGLGVVCPRNRYVETKKRPEFKQCGVYILLGEDEESGTPIIYIGEADEVLQRIDSHYRKKDFWQQAIIFTSQSNTLNKAQVRYLEAKLVNLALANNRCKLDNDQTNLALPNLSEPDRAEVEWYLNEMLPLLPILGVTAFEKSEAATKDSASVIEYHLSSNARDKTFKASGYETSNGFVVRAGSTTVLKLSEHATGRLGAIRQELIDKGVLREISNSKGYEFTVDYEFSSPSMAAMVCTGRSANGRREWKDKERVSLQKHQDALLELETISEDLED